MSKFAMVNNNFSLIITALLLLCSNAVISQENNPEFELVFDPYPTSTTIIERSYELESGDLVLSYVSYISEDVPGLLKVSSSGEILANKEYHHDDYRATASPILINTQSDGLIVMGCKDPVGLKKGSTKQLNDQSLIYFYNVDNNLEINSSREYNVKVDTTEDIGFYHLRLFSAFEADGGIWACIYKRVSNNPGQTGNDSIYFCRFDYEGNWVDTKYMELIGCSNQYAFYSDMVTETEAGYNLFMSELKSTSGANRQMVVQKYDKNFNFISEVERPHSSPDYYALLTVKKTSSGNTLISSEYDDYINFEYRVSLTEFDDNLNVHNQIKYTAIPTYMIVPATISGVDYVDENKIFFAYIDHYEWGGYFDTDNWIYIKMLTRDLEEEKELYYDYMGENSYFGLYSIRATQDGGVLLNGVFCDFVNAHKNRQGFAVKFPPEAFLSIEDAHANGLKTAIAYPNPGNNTLNIRTSLKDAVVEVYDIQGRMIYNQDITENITSVSTESWNSGMYLWRVVRDGKECEAGKWVKD